MLPNNQRHALLNVPSSTRCERTQPCINSLTLNHYPPLENQAKFSSILHLHISISAPLSFQPSTSPDSSLHKHSLYSHNNKPLLTYLGALVFNPNCSSDLCFGNLKAKKLSPKSFGSSSATMAISGHRNSHSDFKVFQLCRFWQSRNASPSSAANNLHLSDEASRSHRHQEGHSRKPSSFRTVSSAARFLLPPRRRLRVDPSKYLYFPYVPGKQVRTAVRLKNTSKSRVAFKFQTTAPKSCYMRPPGGIIAPGESLIAIVFKFVEQPEINEKIMDLKNKVKFKIMSLKVKDGVDYVPELFDEQKDQVTVERILRAVFRDPERPCPALEKMKRQLAEADAEVEARESRKKPPAETSPRVGGEGLVIDEWKVRRERYLARQVEAAAEST